MKGNFVIAVVAWAVVLASEWISVGIAVSTAIRVTGNWKLLWFFLIPAFSGPSYHHTEG